jgi:putative FmdB family regulatory protein
MPIYEYRCAACGHDLEALQKMSDSPLRKCPECGKSQLRRLVSAPSFRLKGGGWYETDFKGGSEKKRNLVESGNGGGDSSDSADSSKDSAAKEAPAQVADAKSAKGTESESKKAEPAKAESKAKEPAPSKPAAAKSSKTAAGKSTSKSARR